MSTFLILKPPFFLDLLSYYSRRVLSFFLPQSLIFPKVPQNRIDNAPFTFIKLESCWTCKLCPEANTDEEIEREKT